MGHVCLCRLVMELCRNSVWRLIYGRSGVLVGSIYGERYKSVLVGCSCCSERSFIDSCSNRHGVCSGLSCMHKQQAICSVDLIEEPTVITGKVLTPTVPQYYQRALKGLLGRLHGTDHECATFFLSPERPKGDTPILFTGSLFGNQAFAITAMNGHSQTLANSGFCSFF